MDELGGLDAALASAKELAGVEGSARIRSYPRPASLTELLFGGGQAQATRAMD